MARQFPAGLSSGRSDVFMLDPLSPSLVMDEQRFNIARWEPTTPAQVRELAERIVQKAEENGLRTHGQLQPIKVRKLSATEYTVAAGFTRAKALKLINTDADFRKRLGLKAGEVYPLRAEVSNQDEDQALLDNADENLVRIDASHMDRANVVAMLSARGWSDKQIATRFGWTGNWVGQLKKLLNLSRAHQKLVHDGTLGVQGAIYLTDVDPDEREQVLAEARTESGKVNGQMVRSARRDKAIEAAERSGESAPAQTISRSLKEVRKFFKDQADPDTGNYDVVQTLFNKLLDYTHGKCGERAVMNAVNACVEAEPVEEDELEAV